MGTVVTVSVLPVCDICVAMGYQPPRKARYDSPTTIDSRWANMCPEHWRLYSPTRMLGTGMGQRLVPANQSRGQLRRRP